MLGVKVQYRTLPFILLAELILFLTLVSAEDYAEYWGEVTIDGNSVPDGLSVKAYIDGRQYARMPGGTLNGYYYLRIPEDNVNTGEKEGGVEGDEIIVKIDGIGAGLSLQFTAPFLGRFDLEIGCIESWQCSGWSSCVNNVQTRVCSDQNNCGTFINKPEGSKGCTVECIPNWKCTEFSSCGQDNKKRRTCTDLNQCNSLLNKPGEVADCEYSGSCVESWQCFEWGSCVDNVQARVCVDVNECGTFIAKPQTSRSCSTGCTPHWQCSEWASCTDNVQTRVCSDLNSCGISANKPTESKDCSVECTTDWKCTEFSACGKDNKKRRECVDLNQCNSLVNKPYEVEDCNYEEPKKDGKSRKNKKSGRDSSNNPIDVVYVGVVGAPSSSKDNAVLGEKNNKKIKSIEDSSQDEASKNTSRNDKSLQNLLLMIFAILYAMVIVLMLTTLLKIKRFIRKKAYLRFMEIHQNPFKVIVKPNSSRNMFLGYDKEKDAYRVAIKAKPEANKANIEVVKFFSKLLKKKVKIIKGLKRKEKIIEIE